MALEGNISIGAPSSIPTPPAGEVTRFFNTDFSPPRLYYKDENGTSTVYPFESSQAAEDCCCEIAENMIGDLSCAVKNGMIEMTDFTAFVQQGVNISGVKTDDGAGNTTCSMSISSNAVRVTGLTTSPTVSVGAASQFTIVRTVTPANASNRDVFWASDNVGVATVSVNGIITGVAPGTCNVTGTTSDGGFTSVTAVTVTP